MDNVLEGNQNQEDYQMVVFGDGYGTKIPEYIERLRTIDQTRRDWISYLNEPQTFHMETDGTISATDPDGQIQKLFPTYWAHGQIAEMLKIPSAYYLRMLREDTDLLSKNVNRWLQNINSPKMLRTSFYQKNRLIAVLSDRYLPISNFKVLNYALTTASNKLEGRNISLHNTYFTDKLMTATIYSTDLKITPTQDSKDTYYLGLHVSNSEVGYASLEIMPVLVRMVCTNGMIMDKQYHGSYTRRHIGSKNTIGDILSSETMRKEQDYVLSVINDIVQSAFDIDQAQITVEKLQEMKQKAIKAEWINRTSEVMGFSEQENKAIWDKIANNNRHDFIQAVTSTANDLLRDGKKPERATELQKKAYKLVNDETIWEKLEAKDSNTEGE